ncbi:MAG: PIG-L deacetylase family protein [Cucumibacter sp.]
MRILALGAHPDDIEIYMFGTLAAHAARGGALSLAVATDGARGGTATPVDLRRIRQSEATKAAKLLGSVPRFLDFPDGELIADATLIGALRELIAEARPDLIITHSPTDYHGDHRALNQATRIAASFASPLLEADTYFGVGFAPTHYVDISDYFDIKSAAIRTHASQDPERLVEAARRLNGFRASQANADRGGFAEAFRFDPVYPFVDIRELLPPAPKVSPIAHRNQQR